MTTDPAEFQAIAFPFLERDPVLHTIIMSNVAERAAGTYRQEQGLGHYVSAHDGGEVIGAAMRTPGRPAYLGALPESLAEGVADAYLDVLPELSGVAGDRPAATAFAKRWSDARSTAATEAKGTRLHKLGDLAMLEATGGSPRLMTKDDVQLAAEWVAVDFRDEPGLDVEWAERHLRDRTLWFWEVDGTPVSMVGHHLPLFGVCRVGPVYTPAEFRRNGYAGALTSHVSAEILADGNQACLYTDLANPTSNKIYFQAGYRPVADFVDFAFEA
ncbi:GNAT family N-acetyltransferase [Kribbella qitaiheensis]|uniref:GNAT family N-acetyltransferase n=1 Tax=Kribbella qitaiheensis TaxID=1544730 RepID=UPI001FE4296E|nr:GNAT family N-acetyltransferase [Kribbella qitaiheensis]